VIYLAALLFPLAALACAIAVLGSLLRYVALIRSEIRDSIGE
jgi:hypothetical protein